MSKLSHNSSEHGTVASYAIGFAISLVLTLVPYFMVVNQTISGNALLVAILVFAVAQLIVQITFFLHLGRGPKPDWNLYFLLSTFALIMVVVGGSIFIINNLNYNMQSSERSKKIIEGEGIYQIGGVETGACQGQYQDHKVTIKDKKVSPLFTFASECDTLIFINEDAEVRELTFGEHPSQDPYAGEYELLVRKGRSKSIKLSELGQFQFHDHMQPDITGYFVVTTK